MPTSPARTIIRTLAAIGLACSISIAQDATPPALQVADGFTVELVAGPPLVKRPVALALDEGGVLYVTDSSGKSPHGKEVLKDTGNRVLRLVDDDGDGRYDRSTVFADGLTFPEGCLWLDGSLYVGTTPTITKLTDADGDGVAEKREIWYDGKTLTGCANDLHGPYLGADGMVYWCKGAFDEQKHTVAGQPWRSRAAHIFRSRPDGSRFEPVMTGGMDNPVDVVQTSRGQRILTATFFLHPEAGRRDGLIHAVHGGVWGKDHDVLRGHRRTGELMPVLTHVGAGAPCGLAVLESRALGDDALDNLIACHFNLRKVTRHVLSDQGSTVTTRDRDLLWSTSIDFHPTDVIEDADGSLLIADTGAWYKICCPTSQLAKPDVLGALYRIRRTGTATPQDPRGLTLDWQTTDAANLAARLADPRPAVRNRAQQALGKQGAVAVPALSASLSAADATTRRTVLWTLARIDDAAARTACRRGLSDSDTSVQEVACHVAALWSDPLASDALLPLLRHDHAGLCRVAVEAFGRCAAGTRDHLTAVGAALRPDSDRFLEHAVIFALQELLLRMPEAAMADVWSVLPTSDSAGAVPVWRALLIAVDQARPTRLDADRVVPLLAHREPLLSDAARWIIAHRPDWSATLVGYFSDRLGDSALTPDARQKLQLLLTRLATSPHLSDFLAAAPLDAGIPLAGRLTALAAMAEVSVAKTPPAWAQTLAQVLSSPEPALIDAAITVAQRLPFRARTDQTLCDALLRVGRDGTRMDDVRVRALAAVPGGVGDIDAAVFAVLTTHLNPSGAVSTRAAAVRALTGANLTNEQKRELLAPMSTCGPLELGRLLVLYATGKANTDEALGLALIDTLRTSKAGPALRAEQIRSAAGAFPPSVQAAAQAWLATLKQDTAAQASRLDELLTTLPTGDGRRGQEIFNSPRAACTTCHTIGYVGGRIGPDLTGVGKVRNRRDLLEAVVFPSASFVRSYEPWIISTSDGQIHLGTIKNEGADFIVLTIAGGIDLRLLRPDIREAKPSPVSLMPAGLDRLLSAQELADLIAFLEARRG